MTVAEKVELFLNSQPFAVVGASNDPDKYGHKCFMALINRGYKAYPVNPRATQVMGHPAFPDLASLPEKVSAVSIITPSTVTAKVVDEAIALGIQNLWMQPGAESPHAVKRAEAAGIHVLHSGPCLLVELASLPRKLRI